MEGKVEEKIGGKGNERRAFQQTLRCCNPTFPASGHQRTNSGLCPICLVVDLFVGLSSPLRFLVWTIAQLVVLALQMYLSQETSCSFVSLIFISFKFHFIFFYLFNPTFSLLLLRFFCVSKRKTTRNNVFFKEEETRKQKKEKKIKNK